MSKRTKQQFIEITVKLRPQELETLDRLVAEAAIHGPALAAQDRSGALQSLLSFVRNPRIFTGPIRIFSRVEDGVYRAGAPEHNPHVHDGK